jgi:hypothetical protein
LPELDPGAIKVFICLPLQGICNPTRPDGTRRIWKRR